MTTSPSKPFVNLDVDDVVADFTSSYLMCVREATGKHIPDDWKRKTWDIAADLGLSKEERKSADVLMAAPNMAYLMAPLPGAIEGVKKLAKKANVHFVTAQFRLSPTWTYDRSRWLGKYFGEELGRSVSYTHEKHRVYADIFVDDKPANVREFQNAWPGSRGLFWATPGTSGESGLPHVYTWEDVLVEVEIRSRAHLPKSRAAGR